MLIDAPATVDHAAIDGRDCLGKFLDFFLRNIRNRLGPSRRVTLQIEIVTPALPALHPVLAEMGVVQTFSKDVVDHGQNQCHVSAGADRQPFIRLVRSSAETRIDGNHARATLPPPLVDHAEIDRPRFRLIVADIDKKFRATNVGRRVGVGQSSIALHHAEGQVFGRGTIRLCALLVRRPPHLLE